MTYRKTMRIQAGFGLIEIVIATGIIVAVFAAFADISAGALRLLRSEKENLEAALLAEEALEIARIVRDESWNAIASLSNGTPYYPVFANGKWTLSATPPSLQEKYSREVVFGEVRRGTSDEIVLSGGVVDPDTRRATARVSWGEKQFELAEYITNLHAFLGESIEASAVSYEGADTDADLANFPSDNAGDGDPAQTFTTGANAIEVSRVDLLLRRAAPDPSDAYVELRASPAGSVLGTSHTIDAATIENTNPAWVEFRFQTSVPLAAGTQYAIRLQSVPASTDAGSGSVGRLHWVYKQTSQSPYGLGDARRYAGRLSNPSDPGQLLDQYDYGFKVYAIQ